MVLDKRVGFEIVIGAEDVLGVECVEVVVITGMREVVAATRIDVDHAHNLASDDGAAAALLFVARGTERKGC